MTYETIEVASLTPVIGAEVSGVDLSKSLGNQTFTEIHDALMAHQVIFFRDQELTHDAHKDFGRRFGELHIHPAIKGPDGHPEILIIHADENTTYAPGTYWHSDVSADAEPPMGSILRLVELPEVGGDTLFASMYAAFDGLSDAMQSFLSGLTAVHASEHHYTGRYGDLAQSRDEEFPSAEHPVVRTHPVTGRKALFVNSVFTTHIQGMKREESRAVLDFLFAHVQTPEFQCRFRWRPNSVAFWDNRCVQHHAMWDYYPQTRHGYRVTVKGDRPV